jgi:hypothetical protein
LLADGVLDRAPEHGVGVLQRRLRQAPILPAAPIAARLAELVEHLRDMAGAEVPHLVVPDERLDAVLGDPVVLAERVGFEAGLAGR